MARAVDENTVPGHARAKGGDNDTLLARVRCACPPLFPWLLGWGSAVVPFAKHSATHYLGASITHSVLCSFIVSN